MTLSSGARLGPYEILSALGAGGMGEVYRARDSRLSRDVAIKVIPEELATDKDRLRRFEQEARATAALSHPNILALFDVGVEGDVHYLVAELLEGETLRDRMRRGRVPVREAADCAVQIARGLAAAHERGIAHRDLKPDNVFLTRDGRVKVLDFGLAKLHETKPMEPEGPTATAGTDAGTRLGTVGYMSPEQARGEPADARSDIFSLGVVLYEMLAGRRAFSGASAVETLSAILSDDPPEVSGVGSTIPTALDRVMRRCLEKRPEVRFQSTHDLSLALEAASAPASGLVAIPTKRWRPWQEWAVRGGLAAAVIATVAGGFLVGRRFERKPVPSFTQLTFRRGAVDRARFAPDGQTVVYGARWDGKPSEVFSARLDLAEAQALSLAGQGAMLRAQHGGEALVGYKDGRLARIPLVGGTSRDVADNINDSDWGPTGDIAAIRYQVVPKDLQRLEYPIGKTLLESADGPLREPRVSPDGDRVALIEGTRGGKGGAVVVVDRGGHRRVLSPAWMEISGLAWSPDGREIWFTAWGANSETSAWGTLKELHAVSLTGRERLLLRTAGDLTLRDISRDGRVLMSNGRTRGEARGKLVGDEKERDLTFLDGTYTVGISADGRVVLIQEAAQAGGPQNSSYLNRVSDTTPIRLGEGSAMALSPDGKRAIVGREVPLEGGSRLTLLSAGADPPRELPHGALDDVGWAWWTPDGQRVVFDGNEKNHPERSYILRLPDGQPQPISPEGTSCRTPAQTWAPCVHTQEDKGRPTDVWELRSLDGGETRPVSWIGENDCVIAWSPDGRYAFVAGWTSPPFRVFRVDVATGRREPWLDTSPPDLAGVDNFLVGGSQLTPDGRYYAYSYLRTVSDLFLVEGLQ